MTSEASAHGKHEQEVLSFVGATDHVQTGENHLLQVVGKIKYRRMASKEWLLIRDLALEQRHWRASTSQS